jgi:hypothetical protein
VTYCEKEGIPFTTFNDWSDILARMKQIVAGELSVKAAATGRNEDAPSNSAKLSTESKT